MPKLSVTIITLNEADHIAAAIDSASWADEILVVDSGSTDATVDIARGKGATVLSRDWSGWIDQKNFAAERASHDWIFSLDADERDWLRTTISRHGALTGSAVAGRLLNSWNEEVERFCKVMPQDYRRVLRVLQDAENEQLSEADTLTKVMEASHG